jgi:uncharacterized membrane protein
VAGNALGTNFSYIIFGSVLGVVVALGLIFGIFCIVKRCKKKKDAKKEAKDDKSTQMQNMSYYKVPSPHY